MPTTTPFRPHIRSATLAWRLRRIGIAPVTTLATIATLATLVTGAFADLNAVDDLDAGAQIAAPGAVIDRSGTPRIIAPLLPSDGESPAIRIVGDGLIVDFGGQTLRGAADSTPQDALGGIGLLIEGRDVTVRNLRVNGYRVGLLARTSDRLVLEDVTVERSFAQRLRSTPAAEDATDWLWPHRNDDHEWRRNYGAAICIEDSSGITLRRIVVRRSQNGIVLSRVNFARIYDNDCSFLSGWGLAMWRSSHNLISRNAFDFCVRGYSHGVYNRGQDSAGILIFEQCNHNRFVENSATHGGDGVFGFAGREALGEAQPTTDEDGERRDDLWHQRRGCNSNVFVRNDLSYAVAHGLELTFSFGNLIAENRFVGNAICGIWGGYSQETTIAMNRFAANGDRGYGLERGGVNIEHGIGNRIVSNVFERNRCGVHLWWDQDEPIMRLPWARANDTASRDNLIANNSFDGDEVAIHLRDNGTVTIAGNAKRDVGATLMSDPSSAALVERPESVEFSLPSWATVAAVGDTSPVGARRNLRGREHIVMTEWGPYDWQSPMLDLAAREPEGDRWRLLGDSAPDLAQVFGGGPLRIQADLARREWRVVSDRPGWVLPYRFFVRLQDGRRLERTGLIHPTTWDVTLFAWQTDPREDLEGWRGEAESGVRVTLPDLRLRFAMDGPGMLADRIGNDDGDGVGGGERRAALATLPRDRFGTIARTTLRFPAGRWRLRTVSDDGVRVVANGETVIENWTWHAPTTDTAVLQFDAWTDVELLVEHFELDGYAVLEFSVERAEGVEPAEGSEPAEGG